MTEQQDVLDPQRTRRRRIPVILLGVLPAAIAATLLVAGPHYVAPIPAAAADASGVSKVVAQQPVITPGVIAPAVKVNVATSVPQITVTLPKPKVVAHVATTSSKKSTSSSHKSSKKSSKKSSSSYKAYCANPNPVSASGSTGKALLAAVNKERAKLGIRALSWSSSMASTATGWSKTQLANDLETSKLIDGLAHNPKRPGAENVAVVYRSTGYSAAGAIKKMHINLVNSNGHCLNLMNPKFSSMGAGVASSSDGSTWYATENFR